MRCGPGESAFHNGVARRLQPSDGRSPEGFALRRIANRSRRNGDGRTARAHRVL